MQSKMQHRAHIELQNVEVYGVDTLKRAQSIKQIVFHYNAVMKGVRIPILRGVSLSIREGERVGFIGRNGSGKSSLLRVIAGIYPAQSGKVRVAGRIAPLIEMGLGFDYEFTGRQNIRIGLLYSGRYQDYNKQMEDRIINFTGLGEKIDLSVKAYSSGMRARLAFAVALFQEPDILLLDEAFATGDAEFIQKSQQAMREKFTSVPIAILVSHETSIIQDLCTRCIWMEGGRIAADGPPSEVIAAYTASQQQVIHANAAA